MLMLAIIAVVCSILIFGFCCMAKVEECCRDCDVYLYSEDMRQCVNCKKLK